MKKKYLHFSALFLLMCGLFSASVFGQTPQKQNLISEVEKLMYSNPNQAVKIAQHLLGTPTISEEEKAKVNLLIAKAYLAKGDLSASLKSLFQEKQLQTYLTISEKAEVELLKSTILRYIYLYKESESEIANCDLLIKNNSKNITSEANTFLLIEKAKHQMLLENIDESIKILESIKLEENSRSEAKLWKSITLGKLYLEKKNFELSKENYNRALQISDDSNPVNLFAKTHALVNLASIYFLEKEHVKVSELLSESLKNAEILNNSYLKKTIFSQQIDNYLALNDTINYKIANKEFNRINNEADLLEEDATNVAYNLISDEYVEEFEGAKSEYYSILFVALALLFATIFGGLILWWRNYQRKKSLDEIIKYLEITRNNLINRYTEKEVIVKELPKRIFIPQDTEKLILAKLKRFESTTRFTSNEISLAVLAGQFDTNTKYLSEIINTHYHVNFNTYINKLRINYLVEKLKSDPNYMNYKISYLAEDCGFSSHSSFATVFKSITGISPVTFIELLKEEKQAIAV